MYGLYLCAPRLKVYAFFEAALYAAVLIVDLPAAMVAAVMAAAIAIPFVASVSGIAFVDGFDLLMVALICLWILLARVSPSAQGGRAAGVNRHRASAAPSNLEFSCQAGAEASKAGRNRSRRMSVCSPLKAR